MDNSEPPSPSGINQTLDSLVSNNSDQPSTPNGVNQTLDTYDEHHEGSDTSSNYKYSRKHALSSHGLDGGYGWVIVVVVFLVLLVTGGILYAIGVLYDALIDEFNKSRADTAWVGSINNGVLLLVGAPVGQAVSIYGCRRLAQIGTLVTTTGLVVSSFATELWHIYLGYGVLSGAGFSMILNSSVTIVNQYFDKKRGLAVGIAVAGVGIGTIAVAPIGEWIIVNYDFRWYLRIMAIASFLSFFLTWAYKPLPQYAPNDEEKGLWESVKALFDASLLKNPVFCCLALGMFAFGFGYFTPIVHIVTYGEDNGIDEENSAFLVSWFGVASTIGRVALGVLADFPQFKVLPTFVLSIAAAGTCTALAFLYSSYTDFIIYVVLFGFFSGSFVSLLPVLVAKLMGVPKMPQAFGLIMTLQTGTTLTGPPMAGFMSDIQGSYDWGFVIAGLAMVVACIPMCFIPLAQKRMDKATRMERKALIDVV